MRRALPTRPTRGWLWDCEVRKGDERGQLYEARIDPWASGCHKLTIRVDMTVLRMKELLSLSAVLYARLARRMKKPQPHGGPLDVPLEDDLASPSRSPQSSTCFEDASPALLSTLSKVEMTLRRFTGASLHSRLHRLQELQAPEEAVLRRVVVGAGS